MSNSVWKAAGIGHQQRLEALAESVNETARMARFNVSLTLVVALYLALTLLSASDENLLRNSVVKLPQFETGISIERSYLLAPVAFLYLHVQTLFLLVVLARKVRTFNTALAAAFGGNSAARAECRDWLSAISFVQGLHGTGKFGFGARCLTWTGVTGVPLVLLLLVDTSFLRYQSDGISLIHHVCFIVDLAAVWLFWQQVGSGHSRSRHETAHRRTVVPGWAKKLVPLSISVVLVVSLLLFAWPKGGYYEGHAVRSFLPRIIGVDNVFDDVLCGASQWRGFCRTLSLSGKTLVRSRPDEGAEGFLEWSDSKKVDHYRRFYGINLEKRSLRFANLEGAYLPAGSLVGAELVGARLAGVTLHGADLRNAELRGADLRWAELHGADLSDTELRGADLRGAELHDADLSYAELHGANLWRTELIGSKLTDAELFDAELIDSFIVGAVGQLKAKGRSASRNIETPVDNLRRSEQCAELTIVCHLEFREIPDDLVVAWDPSLTLIDHLLAYEESK